MVARTLATAWLAAWAAMSPASSRAQDVSGQCAVTFYATSTLHDFEGAGPCSLLDIDASGAHGSAYRARAEVEVKQLQTGISARDEKMRAMFDAEHHPRITAAFAAVDPAALRARRPDALVFRIAIRGVEREVKARVTDWSEQAGRHARLRAEFELSLADFGLEAPVAMGFMRVGDLVRVAVDVDLAAA